MHTEPDFDSIDEMNSKDFGNDRIPEDFDDFSEPTVADMIGDMSPEDIELLEAQEELELLAEKDARIGQLERTLVELEQQRLREIAEFQNVRKRQQQELAEFRKYATEGIVTELLPVLDNLERTLVAAEKQASLESLITGVKLIDRQLRSVLETVRLHRIDSVGHPFDPALHEAVTTEISEEHPEDTIVTELEPGYRLAERVIRPARVKVSKKS